MMDKPITTDHFVKSPLIFLFLVAVLVVSTLVVASDYFLRPQVEANTITQKLISQESTPAFIKTLDVSQ